MQPSKPPGPHPQSAGLPCSARGPAGDTLRPRVLRGPHRPASAGVFSRGVAILCLCYVTGLRSNGMIASNTLAFTGKSEVPEVASAGHVAQDTACRSEGSPRRVSTEGLPRSATQPLGCSRLCVKDSQCHPKEGMSVPSTLGTFWSPCSTRGGQPFPQGLAICPWREGITAVPGVLTLDPELTW